MHRHCAPLVSYLRRGNLPRTLRPVAKATTHISTTSSSTLAELPTRRTGGPAPIGEGGGILKPKSQPGGPAQLKVSHTGPFISLTDDGNALKISFGGDQKSTSTFHALWLRDHCRCEKCFHHGTMQRLFDSSQLALDMKIKNAKVGEDGKTVFTEFYGDKHTSHHPLEWLRQNSYCPNVLLPSDSIQRKIKHWDSSLANYLPTVPYNEVMAGDEGLTKWLKNIDEYGIGFVNGVPPTPEATEALTRRICFIRESHYGAFWDFSANNAHGDTAYTNIPLPAHTDTTYFTDPIGIQLFHLLATGTGGSSLYVDGFRAASLLKQRHPTAYSLLSSTPVPTHCAGDADTCIVQRPGYPIFRHDPVSGELLQVRFNNDDRSPVGAPTVGNSAAQVRDFYAALKAWMALLKERDSELWVQLQPGTVVAMDNWRVLHGRSSFTGFRRMCGAYLGHDDYSSRVRNLVYGRVGRFGI